MPAELKPRIAVVVTTIGNGQFLEDYHAAACAEGVLDRLTMIVIPDRKTPPLLYARCQEFAAKGLNVICATMEGQQAFLKRVGFDSLVPFDSDNRRNIGYLMALATDAPVIISIDDDNYCRPGERFFAEHSVVGAPRVTLPEVKSTDGWFNICSMLECEPSVVYPRGYPYRERHRASEILTTEATGKVAINAGLWLQEPDLDGMTWLVSPTRTHAMIKDSILLGRHVWSPINTQNTALHRDVMPSYYFARMNYPLAGMMSIDRYGDILSGYLSQACVKQMGEFIRVGTPLVDHRRNSHNYLKDATCEMGCVWLMEDLTAWLTGVSLSGSSYSENYQHLASQLDDEAERFTGFIWTEATRGYVHQLAHCMRKWTTACGVAASMRESVALAA